ncbi:MAG: hypothetical protein AB1766_12095 [Pseudomonadota bacterium]
MRFSSPLALATLLLAVTPSLSHTAPPPPQQPSMPPTLMLHFSEREAMFIRDWYRRHRPPGLERQSRVPPGHAQRLARGDRWPPAAPWSPLPPALLRELKALPQGYGYYRVGSDVVIASPHKGLILDVIDDIAR